MTAKSMKACFEERRFGRLCLNRSLVDSLPHETWLQIFGTVVVLKAQILIWNDFVVYDLCGPHFDHVPIISKIPKYILIMQKPKFSGHLLRFEKQEDPYDR